MRKAGLLGSALLVGSGTWVAASTNEATAAAYNLRGLPQASFVWSPRFPHIGEPIVLTSTSSEAGGRIVRQAWDFHDNGPFGAFEEGAPVAGASFATPAPHVIRLRVTDQDGATSIAAETIQMTPPPASARLITPFPVVRIRGRDFARRVKIEQLAVKAPRGTLITATCIGRRCPVRSTRRTSRSGIGHLRWTRLPKFQRFFPARVTLHIRASAAGEIGAYTRFTVRRRKLPLRADSCLDPTGVKPIPCPSQ